MSTLYKVYMGVLAERVREEVEGKKREFYREIRRVLEKG